MANPISYNEFITAVQNYYNGGSEGYKVSGLKWEEVSQAFSKGGITTDNYLDALEQYPDLFNVTKRAYDGKITSVSVNTQASANIDYADINRILNGLDSNLETAVVEQNAIITVPTETSLVPSPVQGDPPIVKTKSGIAQAGNFVFGTVLPAIGAASIGIGLGTKIDSILYNLNPDFWDAHNMSSLDPTTWSQITNGDDSFGANLFNAVFRITPDTKATQMYLDENAFSYICKYLNDMGAFEGSTEIISKADLDISPFTNSIPVIDGKIKIIAFNDGNYDLYLWSPGETQFRGKQVVVTYGGGSHVTIIRADTSPFTETSVTPREYTHNDKTVYYKISDHSALGQTGFNRLSVGHIAYNSSSPYNPISSNAGQIAWTMIYGNGTALGIEGISPQPTARLPYITQTLTIPETKALLQEQYPEIWDEAVTNKIYQPDGSYIETVYVPVPVPDVQNKNDSQPTSTTQTQENTEITPDTLTEGQEKFIIPTLSPDTTTNPPDTGSGDAPPLITPSGTANALYSIYNPTQAEINSFGAWLWSTNFVDQLLKLFNDPMQAVIGLHKIFISPSNGGRQNIKVGYLDSGVGSDTVNKQYSTLDCGTVSLREYFGNVFDYAPYTSVQLYLPFIGFVNLDVADVMRSEINVVYHADVLTGACLAEVKVHRDNAGGTIYQFSGDCAVHYPLSSGSYLGIISGLASGITGAVAGFNLGGIAGAALGGIAGGIRGTSSHISQHGQFTGNAGAMGIKKPFLVITRPQTAMAENFETLVGYPANHYTELNNCIGFTKVKECHVDAINVATDEEKEMIERLLKSGVIIQ